MKSIPELEKEIRVLTKQLSNLREENNCIQYTIRSYGEDVIKNNLDNLNSCLAQNKLVGGGDSYVFIIREGGNYAYKSLLLNTNYYNFTITTDTSGQAVLIIEHR